ncbi:hypothetical protein B484DRAFT_123986 [Ochromonadaceae sp. CCMP2298]|nr:hypothetical protein B484DRAFT_123986 [Ochromonadaceae sp. CCMP2298]
MQQLSELFNVNHFVVSQVNPHSAILSSMAGGITATVWSNPVYNAVVGYLRFLTAQCRDWLKNVVKLFVFRSRSPIWSSRLGSSQQELHTIYISIFLLLSLVTGGASRRR